MNEKRKQHRDYINNIFMTPEQEKADDLACAIKFLMQSRALPTEIIRMLNNMLQQLEDTKNTIPKKILRSIEAKIGRIQDEYQNRR